MVARIFTDITHFEIRVSWTSETQGYVNGVRFEVENEVVTFPNHPTFNNDDVKTSTRNLVIALRRAVHRTPEYQSAKRESRSNYLKVVKMSGSKFEVRNHLNQSVYDVVMHAEYSCTCPDHNFRKTECKHIKAVKKQVNKPEPVMMPSWNGKALNPRLRVVGDISEAQLREARESLGI